MRMTKQAWLGLALLPACLLAQARPVIIEESARVIFSDPDYLATDIALDGNDLLVMGIRYDSSW